MQSIDTATDCHGRSRPVAPAVFAAAMAVLLSLHALDPAALLGQVTYGTATFGAAIFATVGALRVPRASRRPWLWVAAGLTMSALGDLVYFVQTSVLHHPEPDVSLADPLWLLTYVALAIGLARFSGKGAFRNDRDAQIDTASTTAVVLLLLWQFVIGPTLSDGATGIAIRLVWSSYPVLDLALLSVLVRVALTNDRRTRTMLALCGGAVAWLFADFAYLADPDHGTRLVLAMNTGWLLGPALMAVAPWLPSRHSHPPAAGPERPHRAGPVRLSMAIVLILAPAALEVWGGAAGHDLDPLLVLGVTGYLVILAFVRSLRVLHSTEAAHARLRSTERYYRALATNASDAVVVVDPTGLVLHESPAFRRLVGLPDTETVGFFAGDLLAPDDPEAFHGLLAKATIAPGRVVDGEVRLRHHDRPPQWLAVRAMDMSGDADIGGIVVNLDDITARKEAEEALHEQAFHDSLTGLANRALFRDRVEHALDNASRTGLRPAVIFVDLDAFKDVNDSLGHDTGDRLLQIVAQRLVEAVRPGDTVARLGGDEFAVLIDQSRQPLEDATTVAERLLGSFGEPAEIDDRLISISGSVGIDVATPDDDVTSLLRNADMAMYGAKAGGKGRWARYDATMRTEALERMQLESDLLGALPGGQFELVYQPVVDISSGRLDGFEALLRWRHPTLGLLAPDSFIPTLEDTGGIVAVGGWVLEEACRTAARWARELPDAGAFTMSVNVSAVQLGPALVATLREVLASSGIDPATLVLEMTETALVRDPDTAAETLRRLREVGVKIAIDDFGTGYSSLAYLRQFPADILKIDRSFISAIRDGGELPAIVRGVLELARTLGLETVAEGVELDCQRQHLRRESCELAQGYLFAKPLPSDEARTLVAERAAGVGPQSLPA